MDCCGLSLLVVTILTGISCEQLTAVKNEESSLEGAPVTLSYSYSKISPGDYFFWYRQDPGEPPELLISYSASGVEGTKKRTGLEIQVAGTQLNLLISSAAATDSAVYYCALQPTVTGNCKSV
ncbi:Ig kappa chain V region 3381 [Nothobranchius furzeri]|uniref:Ig kappa chain V region 3381 n=1 Tax=Nothobranchius furzeri TaxID=105023 RepID=UPI003904B6A6